ncbi:TIGR03915 family putative DNA repair protein [Geoalkalibacter sp.]|uniref:TIGR03915 family putative DNA repair protein n=1 Tax=Geoalkalibacter sp. TaxID=3041440 RepID=UPI00272E700C|nr:TIGR03915 family putative DNA repair protein [Geoalkalibacter sp.]
MPRATATQTVMDALTYHYDGSYVGLLSVLYRIFSWRETPATISAVLPPQDDLFAAPLSVPADPSRADQLLAAIRAHLSPETASFVRHAYFSEAPGVEMALYRYLSHGWRVRRRIDDDLADPAVAEVQRLAQAVRREAHRLKGLARFRETSEGLLYAPLEPAHFVLPLLAPHFAERLSAERWLLHDVRRGQGVLYENGRWVLADLQVEEPPQFSEEEALWQDLWRTFHRRIAIAERVNLRRQRGCMPMKYWRYLVEME